MRVVASTGESDLATVYVGELDDGERIEFVESVQPPVPREQKWVLIVSTLRGCPVNCPICDAGVRFGGRLTADEILWQIDYMVRLRFPTANVSVPKFKIQFARMGDPAFNQAVLDVLESLPLIYPEAPGLLPSISTIAPTGTDEFFERLPDIKERLFPDGRFQMQFSLHTSDESRRFELIPAKTWSFSRMAEWGTSFHHRNDRKVSLNFAPVEGFPLDAGSIASIFSPEHFMVKLTPVNPTFESSRRGMHGVIDPDRPETASMLVSAFRKFGFDTLLSIGETRENLIGSNCGMYVGRMKEKEEEEEEE